MSSTEAYDIVTGGQDEVLARAAGARPPLLAGWAGPEGPAIDPRTWPRSPRTGQPLEHCFTLWLPEAYRRRGPELVAVSVFQWTDAMYFADPVPHVQAARAGQPIRDVDDPGHPFWSELAASRPHPLGEVRDDEVSELIAMVWLTQAELTGPRRGRPARGPVFVDGEVDDPGWSLGHGRFGPVWLVPRDDPNAGVPPVDRPSERDRYVDVRDRYDRFGMEHLGGTLMDPDGGRPGISPWYLEVDRLGGFTHGGDHSLQLDLDAASFLGD